MTSFGKRLESVHVDMNFLYINRVSNWLCQRTEPVNVKELPASDIFYRWLPHDLKKVSGGVTD